MKAPVLNPRETNEQAVVIKWAEANEYRWPELALLYAIPNAGGLKGGFKSNVIQVQRMRREGVKKGVPDLCLPVARGGWFGLYVEMKRAKGGKFTEEQIQWLAGLEDQNYAAWSATGADVAIALITDYLKSAPTKAAS